MRIPELTAVHAFLKNHLSPARYRHTLGTLSCALDLARRHRCDPRGVEIAVLLHDAGKGFSHEAMVRYVRRRKLQIPDRDILIRNNPELLHSYISADIARRVFKINDRDVLHAICSHTFGTPRRALLAEILYVADAIAADRTYPGVEALRRLSKRNLDAAYRHILAAKLAHVVTGGHWMAPETFRAWNARRDGRK